MYLLTGGLIMCSFWVVNVAPWKEGEGKEKLEGKRVL